MKRNYLLLALAGILLYACIKKKSNVQEDSSELPITYTQPVPDSVFTSDSKPFLDLDNNGSIDFTFSIEDVTEDNWQYTHYYIEPKDENQIIILADVDAQNFTAGTLINSSTKAIDSWSNNKGLLLEVQKRNGGGAYWIGSWNTPKKQYLPVRIRKNSKYYYGWIEMRYNLDRGKDKFIISATAVHKLAEQEIKAGE
jgi:hypothetical protein